MSYFQKFGNSKMKQDATKSFKGTTVVKLNNDLGMCDLEQFMDKKCKETIQRNEDQIAGAGILRTNNDTIYS